MIKTAALILLGLVVLVLLVAATKPSTFRVARSVEIAAAPEGIFPLIDDLHRWVDWSPFEKLESELKRTYSGPKAGKGAVYAYVGQKAGEGRLEIVESSPYSHLVIQTDFVKPFAAHNVTEFTLERRGEATRVTWAMSGPVSFMGKVFNVFVNPESFLGPAYEQGLSALKALAEAPAAKAP